ncbi:unnamed protein product [Miscanthus lutarioriparius]|uniref:Uncharacterized protein n=1 Tax=Miscanthus lutarioriparius TaxID=422564 RepID=A0A811QAE7_9POAL|nr:unnamed protein product [Miscanthus lutarioriparius]
MEIVTGALPSVITKLGELLVGEYNLQKWVKGEIMFLQAELESMKGALEKVSSTPPDRLDVQDKMWARNLRELSYDIEDNIDTFMVRGKGDESAKLHGVRKFIDRSVGLFRKVRIRHEIGTEISDIKKRVLEVHERHRRYDIDMFVDKPTTHTLVDPRLFAHYTEAKELVGIDDTRDELIKVLMDGNGVPFQQGKIVSIIGFGGLGKTTLAKAVFEKIRALFDCCAFVSVSQTPDLKKLFKGLLYDLSKINEETLDEKRLIDVVREFLKTKRYLIVMDDIWDISVWKVIKCALPDNDVGYIVITTTRNADVAENVGGAYKVKALSENNSRKLLYKRVFGIDNVDDTEKCPVEELAEVSDRILNKCAGVPLAIITMASLLACKARNKMDWYEVYRSIGTGLENNLDVENMRKILSFSYYNMPSHLKTCLLYFSMFPEDYIIEKDHLIWMWIAEGFIQSEKQGKSLFGRGESYFNELINRSMIQPIYSLSYTVYGCRVHDMVLDLICSLSSEANLVTVLNGKDQMPPSSKFRRLSIQNGKDDDSMTLTHRSLQQVRSVVVVPSASGIIPVLQSFQVLRVMDLRGCDLSQGYNLNKFLGNLFHLRYLGLGNTSIVELPEEIGNLQFLQILDIWENEISCLPSNVVQLKQLMCLNIDLSTRVPNGIGSLTSLEKLSRLSLDESNMDIIEELGQLTELRVLHISLDEWNHKLVECLHKLQKIQELTIWVQGGQTNIGGLDGWVAPRSLCNLDTRECCWFSRLPAWLNPSLVPGLSELSISVREVQQADLDILGKLPALRSLSLFVYREDFGILVGFVVGSGSFACLRYCAFMGFVGPVVLQHGAMPRLRVFKLQMSARGAREIASSYGSGLDLGLGNLASLQWFLVYLDCAAATDEEVEEFEAALRHATKIHPNHPYVGINGKRIEGTDEH